MSAGTIVERPTDTPKGLDVLYDLPGEVVNKARRDAIAAGFVVVERTAGIRIQTDDELSDQQAAALAKIAALITGHPVSAAQPAKAA